MQGSRTQRFMYSKPVSCVSCYVCDVCPYRCQKKTQTHTHTLEVTVAVLKRSEGNLFLNRLYVQTQKLAFSLTTIMEQLKNEVILSVVFRVPLSDESYFLHEKCVSWNTVLNTYIRSHTNKASEEAEPPMTKPHYRKKRLTGRAATYLFRMQATNSIYHVSERWVAGCFNPPVMLGQCWVMIMYEKTYGRLLCAVRSIKLNQGLWVLKLLVLVYGTQDKQSKLHHSGMTFGWMD